MVKFANRSIFRIRKLQMSSAANEVKVWDKTQIFTKLFRLAIVFSTIFLLGFLTYSHKFEKIECKAQKGSCHASISRDLESKKDLTLFTGRKELEKILLKNIYVEKYNIQFLLPNTIKLQVVQKEPFFALLTGKESSQTIIARDGTILEKVDIAPFPLLKISDIDYQSGQKVKENVLFALEIITSLDKVYEIKESNLKIGHIEVVFENGRKVLFPDHGDKDFLTGSTVLIFNQLNKDDNDPRIDNDKRVVVDLRFKYPVLKPEI